jgi:hypothetical protein
MTTKVADLTFEELKTMVEQLVASHVRREFAERPRYLNDYAIANGDLRTLEEVFASIDRHMITPLPGTPSTLEMLREDRDNDELYR